MEHNFIFCSSVLCKAWISHIQTSFIQVSSHTIQISTKRWLFTMFKSRDVYHSHLDVGQTEKINQWENDI